jgi:hypothetical protein
MEGMRRLVEYVEASQFGQIRDVYCFDDRLNAMQYRPPAATPPKGMDWDLWCGPAPVCDYYAPCKDHGGMHPHDWHSWIGYGNGSIGNGMEPPRYVMRQGDLVEQISGQYGLIVANIVADAIIALSKNIPAFLKAGGAYIVSGIIDTRETEVVAALTACGFTIRERHEHGGWLCFVCGKD